jgi:hypothetical protein
MLRLLGVIFRIINKRYRWHFLVTPLQILNLIALRVNLRKYNLHDTETTERQYTPMPVDVETVRAVDGTFNDMVNPMMGSATMRFGRNMPIGYTFPQADLPGIPSPRQISRHLMTRQEFIPAPTLNVLAAAWVQFQVHDWFSHGPNDKTHLYDVPLDQHDDWPEPELTVPRTMPNSVQSITDKGRPPTFLCPVSHWWDGSQVYGNTLEKQKVLREAKDGRLKLTDDGLLPIADDGSEDTGTNENWWIGLTTLHTLFAREHNAIAIHLKARYPSKSDDALYQIARHVNSALIAKIHTVEWTPALLNTPALNFAMRANWWGLMGRSFKKRFGRIGDGEILSGIIGSRTDHHNTPYAMTEEFVSVYRMHALVPDDFTFRHVGSGKELLSTDLDGVTGQRARNVMEKVGLTNVTFSLGTSNPGAITLGNFPRGLQRLRHNKTGRLMDLAAIDILRDRERGVPLYNQFRQMLDMPTISDFDELDNNPDVIESMREIYADDVDRIDLQVGLLGERPPKGFAFSDTAFRIFILLASRRLKSDRFFTTHFGPDVYTKAGLDWVEETTMSDVILRHMPDLESYRSGEGRLP